MSKDGVWKFTVACPNHNHPLEENLVGHSIARRMTTGQESLIINAIATGAPPRAALALAREQDPTFLASSQDVKNLKKKKRKDFLAGRSLIDAFFESLQNSGHTFQVELGSNGEVVNLFLANPISIELARKYNKIILMDCTYKTNKYRMPVLNIIGITPNSTSFFVGFCFMKQEETGDFKLA